MSMSTTWQVWRRWVLLAAAGALAAGGPASAQAPAEGRAPIRALGVFALMGDSLQLAQSADATDTRIDRNLRSSLTVKDLGLDQAALRAVRDAMARSQPTARLDMFRATTELSPAEQRALSDGAAKAELPGWIVGAIEKGKLSHILLITRHRGEASFPVADGFAIGRGMVEGVGYYIDTGTEIRNQDTGLSSRGYLGAYAHLRVQLMATASGDILASRDVHAGQIYAGRNNAEIANIWLTLDPVEKTEVLRQLVQRHLALVLPEILGR